MSQTSIANSRFHSTETQSVTTDRSPLNVMRHDLAPELADGVRLNLNRPFGNGRDDDANPDGSPIMPRRQGYGMVDEPADFVDRNGNDRIDNDDVVGAEVCGGAAQRRLLAANAYPNSPPPTFQPLDANGDGHRQSCRPLPPAPASTPATCTSSRSRSPPPPITTRLLARRPRAPRIPERHTSITALHPLRRRPRDRKLARTSPSGRSTSSTSATPTTSSPPSNTTLHPFDGWNFKIR